MPLIALGVNHQTAPVEVRELVETISAPGELEPEVKVEPETKGLDIP
jgi:glutamyl-tRNA reductase